MLHDNYTPPETVPIIDGPPTEDGLYVIYTNGKARIAQYDKENNWTFNPYSQMLLVNPKIDKCIGPLPDAGA